jgi:hypothetical protein
MKNLTDKVSESEKLQEAVVGKEIKTADMKKKISEPRDKLENNNQ